MKNRHRCLRYARLLCLAQVVLVALVSPAAAQPTPSDRADALFEEGREASMRGDWVQARARFAESYAVEPTVGTLMNLADAEDHLGFWVEALARWKDALSLAREQQDVRVAYISERITELNARVPRLTIRFEGLLPEGTSVTHNGREVLDSVGEQVAVNPGTHVIQAVAPGRHEQRFDVALRRGERKVITLTLTAVQDSAGLARPTPQRAPARERVAEEEGQDRTLAYVLGGVGVAGAVVGAVTGMMLRGKQNTIDSHCSAATKQCDDPSGPEAADSARSLLPVNVVAWTVGLVGLGSGTLLYLIGGSESQETVAGVSVTGRF
jgi:hypothetical protein